ncbi:hypothetical protein BJ138DRAFT_1105797 [Hygrophoropsis aurantiaca]|uniref:Uncharacterized protein n=1 Tax=Hygrophoropsis aurantiaca TaxID=72124 RepID=A0ACB7ZY82_9AGAM|nr:hypothetical protein BJ138DRAFT_1105797 [Hygrophoropsis aurantiaca]
MLRLLTVPPRGKLQSTVKALRMHYISDWVFDVTEQVRLGGNYANDLMGLTPRGLVPVAVGGIPPPTGLRLPRHTGWSQASADEGNWERSSNLLEKAYCEGEQSPILTFTISAGGAVVYNFTPVTDTQAGEYGATDIELQDIGLWRWYHHALYRAKKLDIILYISGIRLELMLSNPLGGTCQGPASKDMEHKNIKKRSTIFVTGVGGVQFMGSTVNANAAEFRSISTDFCFQRSTASPELTYPQRQGNARAL